METLAEKYYVPKMSEFHEGFAYELFEDFDVLPESVWHKQVYGENGRNPESLDYVGSPEKTRVKWLDREDIESTGFVYTGKSMDNWYTLTATRVRALSNAENRMFRLQHDFRTNQGIVITAYEYANGDESGNAGEIETLYRGSCRNINELRDILTKIGIL